MHKNCRLWLTCACALLLAACTPAGPTFSAQIDTVRVTVSFAQPIVANYSIPTTIRFYDGDQPRQIRNVVCDLQMPGMVMGSMRPIADAQADGSHLVNLLFTMDGEWSIIITGESDDGPVRFYVEEIFVPSSQPTPTITR